MPSKARLEIFLKNIKKGPKIDCLALKLYTGPPNCITGASKSGGQGGAGPPPGSASAYYSSRREHTHMGVGGGGGVYYYPGDNDRTRQGGHFTELHENRNMKQAKMLLRC